jgi:hypothetical protein
MKIGKRIDRNFKVYLHISFHAAAIDLIQVSIH